MSDPTLYRHWHLAADEHEISTVEFEWSLLRFHEAFERFCLQLASTCGLGSLTYQDIVILHVIGMQDRPKPVTIIARLLNRDDIPNIQYSLRKLVGYGYIQKAKEEQSKNQVYSMTEEGKQRAEYYAELRRQLLSKQTAHIDKIDEKQAESARLVSILTGIYDEAGRIAATYPAPDLEEPAPIEESKTPTTKRKAAAKKT